MKLPKFNWAQLIFVLMLSVVWFATNWNISTLIFTLGIALNFFVIGLSMEDK